MAVWLGLASPLLLAHFVSGAHNDALMVGLLVAGLAYAVERQGLRAALLIGLAGAVKVPALVALPFVALLVWPAMRRWRALLVTSAPALAVLAAVSVVAALGPGWLGALRTPGMSVQWTSLPTGLGLAVGWVLEGVGLGSSREAVTVARTLGMVVTLVVLAVLWWRARGAGTREVVAAFGWGLAATVLLAAAFHPWYALWPVAVLAASTVSGRVRTVLAVAATILCFLVLPDGYNLARVTTLPGVLLDVAVTLAATVWAVRRWAGTPEKIGT
jgi:alpha-1,6-mannosyltransferase